MKQWLHDENQEAYILDPSVLCRRTAHSKAKQKHDSEITGLHMFLQHTLM
jgi:hypothetical protein